MKRLKRLLSVVLALTMMLSLVVVVSASNYSITITHTEEGITYNAYKIFDATYNTSTESYAYTIAADSPFLTYLQDNYSAYFTFTAVSSTTYAVDPDSSFDETVAAQLAADLKAAIDAGTISATVASTATVATGDTSVTLDIDDAGYYFVDTSLGSLAFLNSVPGEEGGTQGSSSITIVEKNGSPGIDKEVSDDGITYGKTSDAAIGDTVYYMTTVTKIHNVSNLVIHDYMEAGLTFDGASSVVVYLLPDSTTALDDSYKLDSTTDYTVNTDTTSSHTAGTDAPTGWTTSACTFEVTISHDLSGTDVTDSSVIVIYYTATVNDDAEIYVTNESNDNSTYLTYGNASYTELESTQTYVYPLVIYKYSEEGTTKTALEDVEFVLHDGNGNYATFTESSGVYTLSGWTTDSTQATPLVTASDGTILITGLDGETVYYLTETETVDGYNLLSDDIQFIIGGVNSTSGYTQGKIYVYSTDSSSYEEQTTTQEISSTTYNSIGVLNQKGSELPATGGIGTTIFYVVGGVLILVAVVLLITKRRMGKEDK